MEELERSQSSSVATSQPNYPVLQHGKYEWISLKRSLKSFTFRLSQRLMTRHKSN